MSSRARTRTKRLRAAVSLALVSAGALASAANASVVHVALPEIATDLALGPAAAAGFQVVFLVGLMGFLLPAGWLADRWGSARGYALGYLVFAAASLACAASDSVSTLLAARLLQAGGAAAVLASTLPLVVQLTPPAHRGKAIGVVLACTHAGWVAGPLGAGALMAASGWRGIYAAAAAAALVAACGALGAGPHPAEQPRTPIAQAAALRGSGPLLAAAALVSCAVLGTNYALAFALRTTLGASVLQAGGLFALQSGTAALACVVSGKLADRPNPLGVALGGAITAAMGLAALSFAWPVMGIASLAACMTLLGAGMGAFAPPVTRAILASCERTARCRAGARLSLARNGGHAIGVLLALGLSALSAHAVAYTAGLAIVFIALAGWALRSRPSCCNPLWPRCEAPLQTRRHMLRPAGPTKTPHAALQTT